MSLWKDIAFATRVLIKAPLFTLFVTLSVAVGLSAVTGAFSVLDTVLLKSLPGRDPKALTVLGYTNERGWRENFSYPAYEMFRDNNQVFTGLFAFADTGNVTVRSQGASDVAAGQLVSGAMFDVLGLAPAAGRLLTPEDDRPGAPLVVVFSHAYWQRRYGADPSVLGRTVILRDQPFTVIGVAPRQLTGLVAGTRDDFFVAVTPAAAAVRESAPRLNNPARTWLRVIGRRKPGVTNEQVRVSLEGVFRSANELALTALPQQIRAAVTKGLAAQRFDARSAERGSFSGFRDDVAASLWLVAGMFAMLLAITCANIASLLVARTLGRRQEMTIRLALGAGRWRLVRQLLAEAVLLVLPGAIAALVLSRWAAGALLTLLADPDAAAAFDFALSWQVLGITTGLTFFVALLFGLAPAWRSTAAPAAEDLRGSGKGAGQMQGAPARFTWVLIAGQVAVAVTLVIGAALIARTLTNILRVELGFSRSNMLVFNLDPQMIGMKGEALNTYYRTALERVQAVPGVRRATVVRSAPGSLDWVQGVRIAGYQPTGPDDMNVGRNLVGPGFTQALGFALTSGRDFGPGDTETAPPVAVVNELFATRYYKGENAVGRTITFVLGPNERTMEIVGIVRTARDGGLREDAMPVVYSPYLQEPSPRSLSVVVQTASSPLALVPSIKAAVATVGADVPMFGVRTMDEQFERAIARERGLVVLSSVLGVLALVLASFGLYGVIAYMVTRQTKEIGIRMALGAQPGAVFMLYLKRALLTVAAGAIAGVAAARFLGAYIKTLLFGVSPTDAVATASAIGLVLIVCLVAAAVPVRRATRVNPTAALRHE